MPSKFYKIPTYQGDYGHFIAKVKWVKKMSGGKRGFALFNTITISINDTKMLGDTPLKALLEHEYQHLCDQRQYNLFFFLTYPLFTSRWTNPWELRSEMVETAVMRFAGGVPRNVAKLLGRKRI